MGNMKTNRFVARGSSDTECPNSLCNPPSSIAGSAAGHGGEYTAERYDEFLCGLANNPVNPKVLATAEESINLNAEGNTLRSWTGTRS